tara:strand:+ start:1946 stop:2119 length:174 start_codon:yes stop_codon:yes gene_type:complete
MLERMAKFCKRLNHILLAAILSGILIIILYMLSIILFNDTNRANVDIDFNNTNEKID